MAGIAARAALTVAGEGGRPAHPGLSTEGESGAVPRLAMPLPSRDAWPLGVCLAGLPSFEQARMLLGPADPAQRAARSALFWQSRQIQSRARLRLGMHDRAEEYIVADGQLCAADAPGHHNHLPMHLKTVRLDRLTLDPGETLDLSARADAWPGLYHREELYLWVRIETLLLAPGSRIIVRGNVSVLEFGMIGFIGPPRTPPEDWPEIVIGGTPHAPFSSVRAMPASAGLRGTDGSNGVDGAPAAPLPSIFGPLRGGPPAGAGGDGGDGGAGGNGGPGQNGGMQMLADIRIGRLAGFQPTKLRIRGQAEAGEAGGDGGEGGCGGKGGAGGDGLVQPRLAEPGAPGGKGGHGGPGGAGGGGGHGGLVSNIFVTAPPRDEAALELLSCPGAGGSPGAGGRGGRGGAEGPPGAPYSIPVGPAWRPRDGSPGAAGLWGRTRPGPPIWFLPLSE